MRKALIILILILGFIVIIKAVCPDEEMRVRIIPSSNSAVDLEIKEVVKEATISYLEEQYDKNLENFISNINSTIDEFNFSIQSYNAKGELVNHQFYNKRYNNQALKDEEVLTFLVKIDVALGDNWWGVIFPQFLEIDSTDSITVKSYFYEKLKKWLRS